MPLYGLNFGNVMHRVSGEVQEMFLLVFRQRNPNIIDPMFRFNTAKWLLKADSNKKFELGGLVDQAPHSGFVGEDR